MNFVCFALNTLPQNGADAFCTARFLNALAESGHQVHLVTVMQARKISLHDQQALEHPRIQITRLDIPVIPITFFEYIFGKNPNQMRWPETSSHLLEKALCEILKKTEDPILLTRDWCEASNVAGCYAKKYAKKWIAHFSDPCPIPFPIPKSVFAWLKILKNRLRFYFLRPVINQIFKQADQISVTCRNAVRFYTETYTLSLKKVIITDHIGDPPLVSPHPVNRAELDPKYFNILHIGNLLPERYRKEILDEFSVAAQYWPELRLILYSQVQWQELLPEAKKIPDWLKIIDSKDSGPREANDLLFQSDMNMIIDARTTLSYCPFLPSKFAYAVFAGKPILAVTESDSEMNKLSTEFEGITMVDIHSKDSLSHILSKIREKRITLSSPSDALKVHFSSEYIIHQFIQKVSS